MYLIDNKHYKFISLEISCTVNEMRTTLKSNSPNINRISKVNLQIICFNI